MANTNRQAAGVAGGGKAGVGVIGVVASSASAVNNIRNGNWSGAALDAVSTLTSANSVYQGSKAFQEAKKLAQPGGASSLIDDARNPGAFGQASNALKSTGLGKFVTKLGGPGNVLSVVTSGVTAYNVFSGESTDTQKIQAGIGVAGALATIGTAAAVGSSAPVVGTLIGLGVGVVTVGAQWVVGKIGDAEHEIHDVEI